jgi:hypothetical protein
MCSTISHKVDNDVRITGVRINSYDLNVVLLRRIFDPYDLFEILMRGDETFLNLMIAHYYQQKLVSMFPLIAFAAYFENKRVSFIVY